MKKTKQNKDRNHPDLYPSSRHYERKLEKLLREMKERDNKKSRCEA